MLKCLESMPFGYIFGYLNIIVILFVYVGHPYLVTCALLVYSNLFEHV